MKHFTLILAVLISVQVAIAQQKAQQYAIKSGYIEYTLTGNTTGTKKIWWDNYGEKSRTETVSKTVTKMFGMKNVDESHTVDILVKDKYWSANLLEQEGYKGSVPYYKESTAFVNGMSEKEQEEFANSTIKALGGERLANETFMGRSCDVLKVMGAKIWVYKGLTLKSEAKVLGIVSNETATKVVENKSVAASQFLPLSNISYESVDQQQQALFGDMSEMGNMESYEGDNEEVDMVPVKYPYDKFQKNVNAFSADGYKKMMVQSIEGSHSAMFMKNFQSVVSLSAVSRKNGDISQEGNFETFTHKGKKCMYGVLDEEDGDVHMLVVEVPQYDTYLILGVNAVQTKNDLLGIFDRFGF